MKNRNRTIFGRIFTKMLIWTVERILGGIPVIGAMFKVACFVFA